MLFNTYEPWKFAFSQETTNLNELLTDVTKNKWGIIGVPFDSTCSYHHGSRYAPITIREASYGFEKYNINFQKEIKTKFYDFGDSNIIHGNCEKTCQIVEENITDLIKNNIKPITIGGEHSISLAPVKALKKQYGIDNTTIIHIDAHRDIIDTYQDEKYSHATVMRRISELKPKEIIQIGIRSSSKEEEEFVKKEDNIQTFVIKNIQQNPEKLKNYLESINNPIYLTIDMDGIDPSIAPHVGNPTHNGLNTNQIHDIIEILSKKEIIGFDLMEVASKELGNTTSILAAKIILDFLTLQD